MSGILGFFTKVINATYKWAMKFGITIVSTLFGSFLKEGSAFTSVITKPVTLFLIGSFTILLSVYFIFSIPNILRVIQVRLRTSKRKPKDTIQHQQNTLEDQRKAILTREFGEIDSGDQEYLVTYMKGLFVQMGFSIIEREPDSELYYDFILKSKDGEDAIVKVVKTNKNFSVDPEHVEKLSKTGEKMNSNNLILISNAKIAKTATLLAKSLEVDLIGRTNLSELIIQSNM